MSEAEVMVIGGGLAGGGAACLLARDGKRVRVLERERFPADKICGEFISVEAQHYLSRLGIDLKRLGGHPIDRLRLARGTSVVEAALPFRGVGLSRRTLDEALLAEAAASGADVRRGCAVSAIDIGDRISVDVAGLGLVQAGTVFLATGKHDLRGVRRRPATAPEDLVGFKAYFHLAQSARRAMEGHVDLVMFDGGYAGLQLVENGRANLCLLTQRQRLQSAGGTWQGLLADLVGREPHLANRLAGAECVTSKPLSIFRVPYGFVHSPDPEDPAGLFRLGDQMGVIPSFTGDGMSIALHSAAVAAETYLQGLPASVYHRRIRREIADVIRRASVLYRIARSPEGRALMLFMAGAWPASLRLVASLTRIPHAALLDEPFNSGMPLHTQAASDGLAA